MPSATMDFGHENTRGKQPHKIEETADDANRRLFSVGPGSPHTTCPSPVRDSTREPCSFPHSPPMTHQDIFSLSKLAMSSLVAVLKPLGSSPSKMIVSWSWWAPARYMTQPQPLNTVNGCYSSQRDCLGTSASSCVHTSKSQGLRLAGRA